MDNSGLAFPLPAHTIDHGPGYAFEKVPAQYGMTLRDYFAGQALSGLCGNSQYDADAKSLAKLSYEQADEMLKAKAHGKGMG